ncbi:WD repeat-containing protein 6 [Mortierella sp. 14UC]|nr:WD repeat-containing protein 6 [Mortierella sp. 14UC]
MDSVYTRAQPVHLTTPVTALAYHDNDILLSGQGPYLKATLISTAETLGCIHLGQDWKIHRIVMANVQKISETIEARLFMVFGAKSLRVLRLSVERSSGSSHPSARFQHLWNIPHLKDWIVDAQWLWDKAELPGEHPTTRSSLRSSVITPPTSIAVGYAHNFVEVYQLPQDPFTMAMESTDKLLTDDNLDTFKIVYSVRSEEHCTLFCGRFHNNTLEDLWFASGTVFCHALLWKVQHYGGIEAPVVTSLIGHEGILFGIRWSDDGKAVCTVSDDRSIRIWNITNPANITHTTHFGHTARVWDCQIVGPYLISISEDASCRVWRNPLLTNAADADDTSDCLACWEGHEGKSAWGVAVSDHGVVATGGGDGGIHLWRLDSIVAGTTDAEQNTKDIDLPAITTYFPSATENEKEFVRDFVIISQSQSVYSTNTGYMLVRNDETETWNTLFHSPLLKNYSSLESSTCGRIVVAGCLSGKLAIISVANEFEPLVAETLGGIKIQFVFVLNGADRDNFRIVVFRANCTVGVFNLSISTGLSTATCNHICDLRLPNNNKAIHAAYFSPCYNLVLLGSRDSTVLVYNLSQLSGEPTTTTTLDSIVDLKRCHGSETVSSILMVTEAGEGEGGKDRISVYSTGRDGSWTKYRLLGLLGGETVGSNSSADDNEDVDMGGSDDEDDDDRRESIGNNALRRQQESSLDGQESGTTIVLQKIFRSKITRGWLEQVFIMDGELLLLGFFNKKLFVYNESKHFEIFSMHSGAANRRRWRFLTNNARLEHTRLMYHSGYKLRSFARQLTAGSELFKSAKLQNNFHGREVRQMRFLSDAQPLVEGTPAPIIFASGGEDCRLRMFQYIPYKTKNSCTALRPLCNLKPSVGSALRCLEWSYTSDPHSFLLFTGGAVESMRAWQVGMSIPNSYQVQMIESHTGKMIPEHTPLSLGCLELAQCPHASENMETRIMDLSVFKIDSHPGKHFVAAVYSDAAIRVWLFDEATNSFVLAIDASYHSKCILQVSHLKLEGGGVLMFTAATDGKIAVWDITRALDMFLEVYSVDEIKSTQAELSSVKRERKRARRDHVQSLGMPAAEVSVHMSGVNGLFVQDMDTDGIVAVSGGDDNALNVTRIQTSWDAKQRIVKVISAKVVHRNAFAHGSAIQAVAMINKTEVVTTSQDQMLTVWGLDLLEDGGADMHMLETQFIHVPDPSTMDTIIVRDGADQQQTPLVAIAGIGVQVFDILAK